MYFAGSQPEFATSLVEGSEGQKARERERDGITYGKYKTRTKTNKFEKAQRGKFAWKIK